MAAREKYKVDTWYDATSRKGSRGYQGESSKLSEEVITKFFVSNLPGGCSSKDLIDSMKGFGLIRNTYIARKYDKLGKRFGFVSFANVRDPIALENEMKDVWMGSYKLFIVLARFVDGEKTNWKGGSRWTPVKVDKGKKVNDSMEVEVEPVVEKVNTGKGGGDGRSFRDTLLNVEPANSGKAIEVVVDDCFVGSQMGMGCALVGKVIDLDKLNNLRAWLHFVEWHKVGIKYVGGLWVWLSFATTSCMEKFLRDQEVWKTCFTCMQKWEGQILSKERLAWVKITGLPICLYDKGILDTIGGKFGLVVQSAELDDSVNNLSYVVLGILCEQESRINEVVQVKWKESSMLILVEEDVGDWEPECLEEDIEDVEAPIITDEVPVQVQRVEEALPQTSVENFSINTEERMPAEGGLLKVDELAFRLPDGVEQSASKKKKRGCSRKKNRCDKSPSPTGLERPKKRTREGDDPFDIDRFISVVQDGDNAGHTVQETANRDALEESGVASFVDKDDSVQMVEDDGIGIANETNATMTLGNALGAVNIERYEHAIRNLVSEEGFQQVSS